MSVTLINPPFLFPQREEFVRSHCTGLRILSAWLKEKGHRVHFLDGLALGFDEVVPFANGYRVGLSATRIAEQIPADTTLVGVSVPFSQLAPIAHEIVHEIRRRRPSLSICLGGVYPSTQPESALASGADFAVIGEGERPLLELLAGNAPGVGVYRNRASDYAPAPGFPDLDELPWPDCDIPGIEEYFTHSARGRDVRSSALVTSRGCPFDCEFCSVHPVCGRKWRARGAENVLGEIAFLNQDYGVRYFEIEDDNFTLDPSRAHLILEGIVRLNEKGAGISWAAPNGLRIDTLDARLLRLVRQSACVDIALALEHADPEMLRIMNKKLDPEKAFRVVSECVELGLPHVTLLVIVGYPGETAERFETCRQFLKRVCRLGGRVDIYAGLAQPYPGTRLLERCRREGWLVHPDVADFHAFPHLMSTSWTVNIVTADFDEREARRRREVLTSLPDSPGRKLVKAILPDAGLRLLRRCRRQMGI